MSLSDLAAVGSLVSGGAVLISLIYLSLQVRQAERNQRAAVNQAIMDRMVRLEGGLRVEPMASVHMKALRGELAFSDAEINHMMTFVQQMVAHALDAWVQRRAHLIDASTFETAVAPVRLMLSMRAYRACWRMSEWMFQSDLGTIVAAELLSAPLLPAMDLCRGFRASMDRLDGEPVAAV